MNLCASSYESDDFDEFEIKFGNFMIGGGIEKYSFENPLEED